VTQVVSLVIGVIGLMMGILSIPIVHERFIDPFRFKRSKGRIITGEYFAAWYTNTNDPPVTWETGIVSQIGRKIRYRCKENDSGFDYELIGKINGDIITGYWKSHLPGEAVYGGATLYLTKRGHIVGMWVGDSKMNNFTWGYWALSRNKRVLETFVRNMQEKVNFRGVDLVALFEDEALPQPTVPRG
jgi:hypothetical protein